MTATVPRARRQERGKGAHVLTGTGTLVRFVLRRERVRLPAWILGIVVFTVASTAALPDLYATAADRQARAVLMQNPGTRAISGPGYGLGDYTLGAMVGHEYLSWVAIFVALMSIFLVVRHTRLEEETGRAELVRSSRVGRHATTTAALLVATAANVVLGVLLALGLATLGIDSIGWSGSLLFGAALASVGVVFAAMAAVTAQLTEHARGASGIAGAVFGLAYVLRAAGDMAEVGGSLLSWTSPIGWAQQTRVFVDDRWWSLLLAAGLTVVLVPLAYWLSSRRDVGASLVATRPGPAHADRWLTTPLGLAWRLHRASLVWWGVALFVFALGYGTLASEVERFVAEMSVIQEAVADIGGTVIDAWLSIILLIFAVLAAVFGVVAAGRARSEEASGRAEPVLATAVSRGRWLASHLVMAMAGSAALMTLAGLGLGLTTAQSVGDSALMGRVLGAAVTHVPAIWLTVGIAVALYGIAARAAPLAWAVIAYAGLVGWLGELLQFPQWAINLSPLGHTPLLPAQGFQWTPLVLIAALTITLTLTGLATFRRRDLATTA